MASGLRLLTADSVNELSGWEENSPVAAGVTATSSPTLRASVDYEEDRQGDGVWQFISSCQKQQAGLAGPSFSGGSGGRHEWKLME